MSCPYSTSSICSSSAPQVGFSSSSSSSSSSTSDQGVDNSNKNRYQEIFGDRYQNIFQTMLQTTSLTEDVAALCTKFTESMEPKSVTDRHQFTSTGTYNTPDYISYTSSIKEQESPLVKAAKNLPDGALNSFILKVGKTSFTKKELLDCLEESAWTKKIDNVKFLLDKSNCFNIQDGEKRYTNIPLLNIIDIQDLNYLFGLGDQELADYLIENNFILNNEAFLHAIGSGNLDLVKSLEDKVVNWDDSNVRQTPLGAAVGSGSIEMLEYIIQKFNIDLKKNINNYIHGIPLIFMAVLNPIFSFKSNRCSMIDYLAKNGADFKIKNDRGGTIFHFAVENTDIEGLKHLRSLLPNVSMDEKDDFFGDTPLSAAARTNNFSAVKYFIENEKVSAESIAIAIRNAAIKPNIKILKYLVNHNPNVNTQDQNGDYPVDSLALEGNLELVQFLVSKGSKINAKTLRYAAESGNLALVKYLVEKGAPFNALDFQNGNYSREILDYFRACLRWQKIKSWNWKKIACVSVTAIAAVTSIAIGILYRR